MNQTHPIHTSNIILLIRTFVLPSTQYVAAQSVQWPQYTLKYLGFKSWQEQEIYLFSKTSTPAPAPTQHTTQWKPELFLRQYSDQCRQSDHSHLSREKFKIQWSYTSTQPVSTEHIGINLFYLHLLCTYLSTGHILLVL